MQGKNDEDLILILPGRLKHPDKEMKQTPKETFDVTEHAHEADGIVEVKDEREQFDACFATTLITTCVYVRLTTSVINS